MKYFVYKTTNIINNKTYIGIHQADDINDGYLGSGVALKRAVKKYGKENFTREILSYHNSFDELLEIESIMVNEKWVKDRGNYNMKTGGQSAGILSDESKLKISETLKRKYESGELTPRYTTPYVATDKQKKQISETLKKRYKNQEHHLKGVEPWNKGNVGVQIPWNKGKVGVQENWSKGLKLEPLRYEHKEKISKGLKEYYKTHDNPMLGKESWNKGKEMVKTKCPHCKKMVDKGNGKRWHFENCKLNLDNK